MKRTILVLLAFLFLAAAGAWAQETGLASLQSGFSYGVFTNEIDGALSVIESGSGPGFSQLQGNYYFGGLGNFEGLPTINGGTASPIWFGYYQAGSMPWSAFLGLTNNNTNGSKTTNQVTNTAAAPVTVGTTTYNWLSSSTSLQQTVPLYTQLNDQAQFLTRIADINTGLYLNLNLNNTSNPANNYTQTLTNYYNSAAAGVAPVQTTNNTVTTTATALNLNNTYAFGIPVFLKTGNIGHYLSLTGSLNNADTSSTFTQTTTVPVNPAAPAGGYTNVLHGSSTVTPEVTNQTNATNLGLNYAAYLPAFFVTNPSDSFIVGVNGGVTLNGATYSTLFESEAFTYTGGGATPTAGTHAYSSDTQTVQGAADYSFGASAGQSFYYDLGGVAQFGFIPTFQIGYTHNQTNPNTLTSDVTVVKNDVNANGQFDNGDTITTTTNSYTGAVTSSGTVGNLVASDAFSTSVMVPVALKFQPKGWVFGITLGAEPTVSFTTTTTSTTTPSFSQTVATETIGGATNTTTTTTGTSNTTKAANNVWSGSVPHNLGVHIDVTDAVKLDIDVFGALAGGVWDFKDLIVQGTVALK